MSQGAEKTLSNKYRVGGRVGAVLRMDKSGVELFGYGTYEGLQVPVGAVGWMAEILVEQSQGNPCIKLDSGKLVYGCECWWGSQEAIEKNVAALVDLGATVTEVDIDAVRERHRAG